jgi:hypothetical protein
MMKLYTMNELIDRDLGPVGTTERDDFEKKVSDDIHAYYIIGKALCHSAHSAQPWINSSAVQKGVKDNVIRQ